MTQKLYLDGCSFTYGLGLESFDTLASLFAINGEYIVTNNSRPGKSNMAIAMDAYKNCKEHDIVILGFTYSSRFYLNYNNNDIDFLNTRYQLESSDQLNGHQLESAYKEFRKYFYTLFETPFCDKYSDFLIDTVCSYITSQGKKVIAFSWEKRKTDFNLLYPYIPPNMRLPDRHLNKEGTMYLYKLIGSTIESK